ncbi:MAG: hypothetical protein JNL66_04130, partial [Alphaproteobacteria bacterium]|nr:hypothetical protein [Alphaproteobacteria bacterium]
SLRMVADAVTALDDAVASAAAGLKVTVRDPSCLDQLKAIIAGERRGRGRVSIVVDLGADNEVEVALRDTFAISAMARSRMQTVPGIAAVEEV